MNKSKLNVQEQCIHHQNLLTPFTYKIIGQTGETNTE